MKQYVVDAFTEKVFSGNPAAICVMDSWLDDDLMMKITIENNLSETAFAVKENDKYKLRWFTPGGQIDLCGHRFNTKRSIYGKGFTLHIK